MASEELFSHTFIVSSLIQHVIKLRFADRRWMCLNGGWEMSLAFFMGRVINQSVEQMDFFLPVGNAGSKEY